MPLGRVLGVHGLKGMLRVSLSGHPGDLDPETFTALGEILVGAERFVVKKAGLSQGFMGHPQPVPFVGHGVGLELDEWPIIGEGSGHILEKGMIIALEPKFIFRGEGVVGVENTFVVGDNGMEKLGQYPDDIVIVS